MQALQKAKADLETLIDTSPVDVVVFDERTRAPVSVNQDTRQVVDGLRNPDQQPEQLLGGHDRAPRRREGDLPGGATRGPDAERGEMARVHQAGQQELSPLPSVWPCSQSSLKGKTAKSLPTRWAVQPVTMSAQLVPAYVATQPRSTWTAMAHCLRYR